MILAEYSKTTSAPQNAIWEKITDVKSWKQWKESIEYIDLDGPFDNEVTGIVKHNGNQTRVFMIKEVVPLHQFVDIYNLPVGKVISCHRIDKLRKNYKITYRVELLGPFAFLIGFIMRVKYKEKIKRGIQKLIKIIEKESYHE